MPESRQPKRYAPVDLDNANIAAGAGIATSKLADAANFILRNGSVAFTGNVAMGGQKITNLGTPTAASTDAARIIDVENAVAAAIAPFTAKGSVRVATTANVTLSGTQTIGGVALAVGERVLVKDQTLPAENGVYVVASGAWARAADMDTWSEIPGSWITVQEGTVNADTTWLASANQGGTLGTTAVTFINPFSGLGVGLSSSNFVFDETPSGTVNGSNTAFTLANTPTAGSVRLHVNGYRLLVGAGNDYTISGSAITMLTAPLTGEVLKADYMKP
jgi:hypothetical protein